MLSYRTKTRVVIALVVAGVILAALSSIVTSWNMRFDDSYISYRYAQNFANGFGLVWNVGEAPTEGYTNLLFVLVIAPFLRLGIDPLTAARIVSVLCLIATCLILYRVGKSKYGMTSFQAFLAPAILLLVPSTFALVLVGLETIAYALGLLASLLLSGCIFRTGTVKSAVILSFVLFLTSLLRPEVVLFLPLLWLILILKRRRIPGAIRSLLLTLSLSVGLQLLLLAWKYAFFGSVLPNPFYIKAAGSWLSSTGLESVLLFLGTYLVLIGLVVFSFCYSSRFREVIESPVEDQILVRLLGISFVVLDLLFFVRSDTLADMAGRFLYPLVPLLLFLAFPIFKTLGDVITKSLEVRWVAPILAALLLVLLVSGTTVSNLRGQITLSRYTQAQETMNAQLLENRQLELAESLSKFSRIKETRIAYGDAGIVPYYTGALWLDPVGLNDSFLARTKNQDSAVDYFFSQSPDLVLLPKEKTGGLISFGHGPLGDYSSWADDPRWDDYEYVGTMLRDDAPYDLLFMVRKESANAEELSVYLRTKVVDGWDKATPIRLGTKEVQQNDTSSWTPRIR